MKTTNGTANDQERKALAKLGDARRQASARDRLRRQARETPHPPGAMLPAAGRARPKPPRVP